ncbi:uncharacterized protein B0T23DRAFT_375854 [Neurospora hispaniola]|uniref:Uncharacterized protein n=1 Tax=Neurospora hispaniola TaxID=588809 RepID=A0AAJ0IF56_9PEZI|nr:hypothetical protein B0T23DRAFT_375854 [Neurospora hispaniola]
MSSSSTPQTIMGNLPRYPVHSYGQDKGGVWATGTTRYPPHERSSCRPKPPVHGRGWTAETARHKPCFTTCEAASPAAPRVAVPARQKQWKWFVFRKANELVLTSETGPSGRSSGEGHTIQQTDSVSARQIGDLGSTRDLHQPIFLVHMCWLQGKKHVC